MQAWWRGHGGRAATALHSMVDARRLRTLCAAAIAAMATCICAAGDAPTCPWFSSCSRRGLRLRGGWAPRQVGGQGPGPDEDMTDDNIRRSLNDSYYEYEVGAGLGGPGDRKHLPDELTSSALDVVRLRFVPRDALSNSAAHQSFHAYAPLYAHQLFGEDECIYGYISPEIDITYSEDSLLPVITFTHVPRQDAGGLACPVPPSATDVLGSIQRKAPADYFSPDQLPPSKRRFEPRGTRVGDYSGYALGRSKPEHGAVESERGGDVRYEVYSIRAGADIGAQKVLLQRAQSIAMWMIESASYIDFEDPNWSCVFVYEKTSPWALGMDSNTAVHETWPSKDAVGAGATYRLVAFTTLYRAPLPRGISLEGLREISPRADELWEKRDSVVRLNVSQFVVLPHFAGQGHGKQLLRHVYREAQADKAVLDVRVEQPTEIFRNMRQSVELELLRDKDKLADLRSDNPPWQQLQAKLKFSMARLFALANHVGCKAGVAGVQQDAEGYTTVAGVRVDLDSVYSRASVLGFTKEEIDDILQAIEPQDMRGTVSAEDAADRLLSSVYMAIVSDVGETQGLTPPQVDELLGRVDPGSLLRVQSGQDIARLILPIVHQIQAGQ